MCVGGGGGSFLLFVFQIIIILSVIYYTNLCNVFKNLILSLLCSQWWQWLPAESVQNKGTAVKTGPTGTDCICPHTNQDSDIDLQILFDLHWALSITVLLVLIHSWIEYKIALPYSRIIPGSGTASLTTVKVSEPEFFQISTLLLPLFIQPHAQRFRPVFWGLAGFSTLDLLSGNFSVSVCVSDMPLHLSKLKTHLFSSDYWFVINFFSSLPTHH